MRCEDASPRWRIWGEHENRQTIFEAARRHGGGRPDFEWVRLERHQDGVHLELSRPGEHQYDRHAEDHEHQHDAGSDLPALSRSMLKDLAASINKIAARAKDQVNRAHLEDIVARIERILDPRGGKSTTDAPPPRVAVERRPAP